MKNAKKEFLGIYNIFCSDVHRFGTDAVLLEYFSASHKAKRVCDLGTGCGIIPFLIKQTNRNAQILAVDIQQDAIALVNKAIADNEMDGIQALCCDLKNLPKQTNGKFDLVTMNPPYKKKGAGKITGNIGLDIARNEIECTLRDICESVYKLLIPNGRFCICQRPERLVDVIYELKRVGIEPKVLRNVVNKAGYKPMLVLIQGIKGANEGIDVQGDLILKNADGSDTDEVTKIYKIMRGNSNG